MKMWRIMIPELKINDNAKEAANGGHVSGFPEAICIVRN